LAQEQQHRRYVHVWDVPDPPDVAALMEQLADSSEYAKVSALVLQESQNLVLNGIRTDTTIGYDDTVIMFRRQLLQKDLGSFLFTSDLVLPQIQNKKWRSLGRFQAVTGYLNSVTEFWVVENGGVPDFEKLIKSLELTPEHVLSKPFGALASLPQAEWRDEMTQYVKL
jgi:hypothetical protein